LWVHVNEKNKQKPVKGGLKIRLLIITKTVFLYSCELACEGSRMLDRSLLMCRPSGHVKQIPHYVQCPIRILDLGGQKIFIFLKVKS
jgi:hypothetical protein